MESAIKVQASKFVFTSSATNIVGPLPKLGFVYDNPGDWVDVETVTRPNDRAKILAEHVCWSAITSH